MGKLGFVRVEAEVSERILSISSGEDPNPSLYACLVLGDGRKVGDKKIRPDEIRARDGASFGSKELCSGQSVGFAAHNECFKLELPRAQGLSGQFKLCWSLSNDNVLDWYSRAYPTTTSSISIPLRDKVWCLGMEYKLRNLGFDGSYIVVSHSRSGRLWLLWATELELEVNSSSMNRIDIVCKKSGFAMNSLEVMLDGKARWMGVPLFQETPKGIEHIVVGYFKNFFAHKEFCQMLWPRVFSSALHPPSSSIPPTTTPPLSLTPATTTTTPNRPQTQPQPPQQPPILLLPPEPTPPVPRSPPSLFHICFNQDHACFAVGTDHGFWIYNCDPFRELFRRDFDNGGGIGVVEAQILGLSLDCREIWAAGTTQPRLPFRRRSHDDFLDNIEYIAILSILSIISRHFDDNETDTWENIGVSEKR
ncbi:hypothetical protein ACFX2I_014920 [Malus domestica]